MELGGQRYLLAGYPAAEWPRNVRAADGRGDAGRRAGASRPSVWPSWTGAAEPILRAWPERIPQGREVMLDAGVVPDPDAGVVRSGSRAGAPVFRIEVA